MSNFLEDILHALVEHSTLGGKEKTDLHAMVDGQDPAESAAAAADQEIADLEAQLAAAKAAKQAPATNPAPGGDA
jgi:hypothetical protein